MEPCIFCYAEFPHEPTANCKCEEDEYVEIDIPFDSMPAESRPVGRPPKDGDDMNNVEAAGRKRSVRAKPIKPGDICEWRCLKEAGGGIEPIPGCPGNPARQVHHGPDKSVLNNDVINNLSKVCDACHGRWHTANDRYYKTPRPEFGGTWLPDDELADGFILYDLRNDGPKMTMKEALAIEMERNQDDARGRIK